jgi:transcriptional regulator with XRE-family HTH domain
VGAKMQSRNSLGEKIKTLRIERGLSKKALSENIGINQSIISRIENDKNDPSAKTLIALSQFFGVTSDWLLFGDIHQNKKDVDFLDEITDAELQKIFFKIRCQWIIGDNAERGWIKVQLRKAFPIIAAEIKKENEENAALEDA